MRLPAPRIASGARLGALATLLLALVLLAPGCGDDKAPKVGGTGDSDGEPVAGLGDAADQLDPADEAFLAERARMTVLLSGCFLGRHKPCGCTAPQLGGLERLAVLVERLRARANGNVLGLSLGWNLRVSSEAQRAAKAELIRQALDVLGFGGLLLGDSDLDEPAMTQPYGGGGVNTPIPPLNVILPESSPATRTQTLHVNLRDTPVRAMSLVNPRMAESLKSGGSVIEVLDVTAPFSSNIQPARDQLWIVACRLDTREAYDALASAIRRLGPAIIVDFGGVAGVESFEDIPFGPDMQPVIVAVDEYGKESGVLDFHVDGEGHTTLSYRTIPLVPAFEAGESTLRDEISGLIHEYLDVVRERGYLTDFPWMPDAGAAYVGSPVCVHCHEAVLRDWNATPHAHAIQTLEAKHYEWDPECVRCHVVGWYRQGDTWLRWDSGFRDVRSTPLLGGVGCENCHGPGSKHVEAPARAPLFHPEGDDRLEQWKRRCSTCHDVENSHGFVADWMSYFEQMGHRAVPSDVRTVPSPNWNGGRRR